MSKKDAKSRGDQPRRIPRPFEKWFLGLFVRDEWKDKAADFSWLITVRDIAKGHGCSIIFDTSRHWRESFYSKNYLGKGPFILGGGAGNNKYSCTAILHELGHHVLCSGNRHPKDPLRGEEEAWQVAQRIAQEYKLPLVSHIKRKGLYSYRYHLVILQDAPGSKRRWRKRPAPKSWQLEGSKRTAKSSVSGRLYSMGKKGKKHEKRYLKRATSKAERRRKPVDE